MTVEATVKVEFSEARRLQNNQRQFTYAETIGARAGEGGSLTVPDTFTLFLAPFEGTAPVEMQARLRYRITSGALAIGYVLDRPDLVLREAFDNVVARITAETGITPLAGSPLVR